MKHGLSGYDLSRSEWERLIDEWIFSERDRKILKRRLLDGVTFERLAEEFDLSTRHVKSIIYKQEQQLFAHI
jgi:DNA-directed RNA polymerase specialized sigma24 family protein